MTEHTPLDEERVAEIRKRHRRVEDEGWTLVRTPVHVDRGYLLAERDRLLALVAARDAEIKRLRTFIESEHPPVYGYGESFDLLKQMGIVVEVPSDDVFREEWGEDALCMWVFAWHPLARENEETP